MPIGVFDSGLGGLTVLGAMVARLPGQDFVYLGDNASAPYGRRAPDEIYALTIAGVKRLFAEGCDLVVLACNTASAVALHDLQVDWLDPTRRRGLGFATAATVASGAFPRELRFRARDVAVEAQACGGLVEAIEAGDFEHAAAVARRHVASLLSRLPAPQSAVLGCTHYPLVESAFRAALPPETALVSQPALVADSLADYLRRHPRFRGGPGGVRYLTTGDPAAVGARAAAFMGAPLPFAAA